MIIHSQYSFLTPNPANPPKIKRLEKKRIYPSVTWQDYWVIMCGLLSRNTVVRLNEKSIHSLMKCYNVLKYCDRISEYLQQSILRLYRQRTPPPAARLL